MNPDISGHTRIEVHLSCDVDGCSETLFRDTEVVHLTERRMWTVYPESRAGDLLEQMKDERWEKQDDGRWYCPKHAAMEFVDEHTLDIFEGDPEEL